MENFPKRIPALVGILFLYSLAYGEDFIDILHEKISYFVYSTVEKLDNFFADPRVKEEAKSYIIIRAGAQYDTSPNFDDILRADFKIRLAKLERSLGLFLESYKEREIRKEEEKPIKISEEEKGKLSIGIEHKRKIYKFLKHKISIGLTGTPKIYAKYQIWNNSFIYKRWEITVYQRFRAEKKLNDYRLEESTELYFDRLIAPGTIWRIYVGRNKSSDIPYQELNYATLIRILNPLKKLYKKTMALEISSGFDQNHFINGRISGYSVSCALRANFWKRWAFWNFQIGSNWSEDRGFKGTPFIKAYLEFYIGKM